MKKKNIIISLVAALAILFAIAAVFLYERSKVALIIDDEAAWDLRDSLSAATSMKVVVLPDGVVARFIGEDEFSYAVEIQDSVSVPKAGASLETWSAADGRGVIYQKSPGKVPVLDGPDPSAPVKCEISYEEGECPCTYACLGLKDGWYEIDLSDGEIGFVQASFMLWDAVDTF